MKSEVQRKLRKLLVISSSFLLTNLVLATKSSSWARKYEKISMDVWTIWPKKFGKWWFNQEQLGDEAGLTDGFLVSKLVYPPFLRESYGQVSSFDCPSNPENTGSKDELFRRERGVCWFDIPMMLNIILDDTTWYFGSLCPSNALRRCTEKHAKSLTEVSGNPVSIYFRPETHRKLRHSPCVDKKIFPIHVLGRSWISRDRSGCWHMPVFGLGSGHVFLCEFSHEDAYSIKPKVGFLWAHRHSSTAAGSSYPAAGVVQYPLFWQSTVDELKVMESMKINWE